MNEELNNILFIFIVFWFIYEGESVNRTQLDIKCKTCDIETLKNNFFSAYPPPTLTHLSHHFASAWKPATYVHKSFHCCLNHFRASASTSSLWAKSLPQTWLFLDPVCEPLYATNTSHRKQETFLEEYPLHWVLLPAKKKRRTERCSSVIHASSTVAILTTETSIWTCACTCAT
jgi:hypothetical protein